MSNYFWLAVQLLVVLQVRLPVITLKDCFLFISRSIKNMKGTANKKMELQATFLVANLAVTHWHLETDSSFIQFERKFMINQ